ncbi:MAG: EpsG family protein [Ruminococcaceae bacterium]|nr:EpsG family protein [Oscillospiraceae bacterium]
MRVWIFMLLSIMAFWVLIPDALGKKKKNLIFLGLSFLVLVFIMGSRSPHMMKSPDLYGYYRMFYRSTYMTFEQLTQQYDTIEQGYLLLNKIVSTISPWTYTLQYLEAAFCTFVIFWYINRNADSVFLGVMIYICVGPWQFYLTGFRQAFAISICLIALELLKKHIRKYDIIGVCLIVLAITMHSTAWIFVLVLFLRNVKVSKKFIVILLAVTALLFALLPHILDFVREHMDKDYGMVYKGNPLGGLIPIAVYLCALVLTYLVWLNDKNYFDKYGAEVTLLVVGLALYTLRYSSVTMERVSFYYTPVITVVLSNAVTRQKSISTRNIYYALGIALLIGLYMYRCIEQYGTYHFFWEYLELIDLYYN